MIDLLLISLSFNFLNLTAINSAPRISDVRCRNVKNTVLTIVYDLYDVENDTLTIYLKAFDRNGKNLDSFIERNGKGDIGFPVFQGRKRKITIEIDKQVEIGKLVLIAEDSHKIPIAEVVSEVDTTSLRGFMKDLSVERHHKTSPSNLSKIRKRISDHFLAHSLGTVRQDVPHEDYTGENIIGIKSGLVGTNSIFIGAHFDAVENCVGADDNASGVAAVMEIARILSKYNLRMTVGFAAFDLEEEGLLGSREFVSDTALVHGLVAYLNLDMIGYHSKIPQSQKAPLEIERGFSTTFQSLMKNELRGDFVLVCSDEQSDPLRDVYTRAAAEFVPSLSVVSLLVPEDEYYFSRDSNEYFHPEIFRRSDHASFWESGLNALSISDTGDYRNPNYHSVKDTERTIDVEFMSLTVKATLAALLQLSGLSNSTAFTIVLDNAVSDSN